MCVVWVGCVVCVVVCVGIVLCVFDCVSLVVVMLVESGWEGGCI